MPFPKIDIPNIKDEETKRAVQQILDRLNDVGAGDIVNGTLLTDVVLSTSALKVAHKLGRKPKGYIPTKLSANAVIYGATLTNRFIELTASAAVTADIWVF